MSEHAHAAEGPAGLLQAFRRIVESRTSPVLNSRRREAFLSRPDPVLRVEAVELAPVVNDEDGNEVADSTAPQPLPHKHPMVKVDPPANRIAHREVKVRVWSEGRPDGFHAGKTVTWSMDPLFVRPAAEGEEAGDPEFRGDWQQAAEGHRDRFEASTDFGSNGFTRLDQERATTTVDATGHTSIRINLPPIAFNAARISAQLEGEDGPVELLDLEVPGIIVIDPGHGGESDEDSSSANNATSHTSGILEKQLTLDFGLRTRAILREIESAEGLNLRIYMTRIDDRNLSASERAETGRDNGADILLSIHFNGFNGVARGTEALVRRASENTNLAADEALAERVSDAVYQAILAHDKGARNRGVKQGRLAVLSDHSLGNDMNYHPIRSALLEVEFIDNPDVDALLSTNENHQTVRRDICTAIATALIEDLWRGA